MSFKLLEFLITINIFLISARLIVVNIWFLLAFNTVPKKAD
jgi:hypothetical protein